LPTAIYTLSLHDALPIFDLLKYLHDRGLVRPFEISRRLAAVGHSGELADCLAGIRASSPGQPDWRRSTLGHAVEDHPGSHFRFRSEEHTSELQSRFDLVC